MSICGLRLYFTDRSGGVGNRALGAVRSLCRREQTLSYLGNQLTAAAGPPLLSEYYIPFLSLALHERPARVKTTLLDR